LFSIVAALLLAATEPSTPAAPPQAPAAAQPPAAAPAPQRKAVDPNERICWNETPVGTHFSERVCATRAQLDAQRRNARETMDRAASAQMGAPQ
jgi:hypothetical protein